MLRVHFFSVLILAVGLAGCGNGGGGTSSSKGGGGGGGGTVPVVAPVTMNVTSGQTSTANILVGSPAATTPPNAKLLGVGPITGTISAFNTGATIQRNGVNRVVLFGPGLSGTMQVSINGPTVNDITISNVQTITATDGTPGISFTATVPAAAATGARTVVLRSTQDDITTFTGGLEVQ